ncbi:MAG TPA: TlpA disulfide reductase family protein [Terriglobales bacterium]|nr:TlpA disulfide reductase family protein [Terriglobales bacterium]
MFGKLFGGKKMAALTTGAAAPDFALETLDHKKFSLKDSLARGPVVLAFFKVSCPTCQYTFPFLERLFQAYRNQHVTLVGVSQNPAKDTAAFAREQGITFPMLLDDTSRYPVSNAYGLTTVPTIFWIAGDGEVEISSVGWVKSDFEQLNRRMAEAESLAPRDIFHPGDDVRDFRAG